MRMPAPTYFTAAMVRALPEDGRRYEVVHGELLVTPAPRLWHQELVGRLHLGLRSYLRAPDTLVQPDVFVVPIDEARTLEWTHLRTLLLVAEVLSPSTARADRFTKRRRYQEAGVPVYWLVDGEANTVEVWTRDAELPVIERERLVWHPTGATWAFTIELAELFRPI